MATISGAVAAAGRLEAARTRLAEEHGAGLRALNALFREGQLPAQAPDGRYAGDLVSTVFGPAVDRATAAIGAVYMPWRGKVFDAALHSGGNLFTASSARLIRPFDPNMRDDSPGLVRAYPFHTYAGTGVVDGDRSVLKIDYDLPANPFGLIRRVLDEVVEVAPGYYLGKAHLRLRGRWRTVAYFALRSEPHTR